MAGPRPNRYKRRTHRGPGPADRPSTGFVTATASPRPQAAAGRYDALGDQPIATTSHLILQTPFRVERAWVERLKRRDVHVKEAFTLRDASGGYFRASLQGLDADGGRAVPYERMTRSPEPAIDLTLACAVLARQRMIFVVQKATELGVTRIVPLHTEHSVPPEGLEHERANAWPAQVVRAAKQCRRGSLPHVLPPMSMDAFLGSPLVTTADACVVLDDRSEPGPAAGVAPKRVVLLVGPEGGFSDAERARMAGRARPWPLGGRILRAETAVLVGLTAVQMIWGDFADAAQHV